MSKQTSNDPSGSWKMILLLIIAGAAVLIISPVSADTGVTIAAQGDQSYYLGEMVVLSGHNYDLDTTYLFITGPGTFVTGPGIPGAGGKLTSPLQAVVSGNPDSFTVVKTKPDKSWEYDYYTANLPVGCRDVYHLCREPAENERPVGSDAANVGIILKKPFITAGISPSSISPGTAFYGLRICGGKSRNGPDLDPWQELLHKVKGIRQLLMLCTGMKSPGRSPVTFQAASTS